MSIQTELTRIQDAKAAIKAAIEDKGVTVPDATLLDGMSSLIENIESRAVEIHVVDFAEEITCAVGTKTDLCDTAINTPICIGMVAYSDGTTGADKTPVLYFGVSNRLSQVTPTNGYACGTTSSYYGIDSKGYVRMHSRAEGAFNSEFSNGLIVADGKLKWVQYEGWGYSGTTPGKFLAGTRYIFFILG